MADVPVASRSLRSSSVSASSSALRLRQTPIYRLLSMNDISQEPVHRLQYWVVPNPPMDLLGPLPKRRHQTLQQMLFSFECRVEIWMLGPAVEMLKTMESHSDPHSIWLHSGYLLLGATFSYFEMIGKILNPNSETRGSAGMDFNYGFCDVYPSFAVSGNDRSDGKLPVVAQFRNRVRNGIFHLGYTKSHLYIHHRPLDYPDDFSVAPKGGETYYCVNPHHMTRTIVAHFPSVVNRLRDGDSAFDGMRSKFREFYVDFHAA